MDEVVEAAIAWIEKHRGWIDCVSFHHPTDGAAMRESLAEALAPSIMKVDNEGG